MENLRRVTLVFLVQKSSGQITDVCLAMKKRGFGKGRWNGTGGKVEAGETVEAGARREAKEELGVGLKDLNKVAELAFHFPYNPAFDQAVTAYISENWDGEPDESEEMKPDWFSVDEIPFEQMWPDDIFWLPEVLKGNLVRASFVFGENDVVLKKEVSVVNNFSV